MKILHDEKEGFSMEINEKMKNGPDAFAETYSVELYLKDQPNISQNKLLENIKKYCGNVELVSNQGNNITFAFMDHILEYKNVSVPVSIIVSTIYDRPNKEKLKNSLCQSLNFKNKESIKKCKYRVLVTDIMAIGLEYTKRIEIFQKALYAIVESIPCEGIHFHLIEQVISREDYLENNPLNSDYDILFGALNVRMFDIEGSKNEYLIDTLGLSALGLCDLQCHFQNLDPDKMADVLYSYGYYIFDKGDEAAGMKAVQGISENDEWKCQHEISIAEPARVVLDINPGNEYLSKNRF